MPTNDIFKGDEGYDFVCRVPGCGFTSTNWVTRKLAEERRGQHLAEHEGTEPVDRPANEGS